MSHYTYIVAGIDGTGSKSWMNGNGTNSHLARFKRDLVLQNGDSCEHFHGPNSEGLNLHDVQKDVLTWLMQKLRAQSASLKKEELKQVRVCLIGHSRGGGAAIEIAKELEPICRVHFLGLYDAVIMNRTYTDVVQNCSFVYHAMRAPVNHLVQAAVQMAAAFGSTNHRADEVKNLLQVILKQGRVIAQQGVITALDTISDRLLPNRTYSRSSFRSTGLSALGAAVFQSTNFMTSHGGVGGDPGYFGLGLTSDPYCNVSEFLTWRLVPIDHTVGTDPSPYCMLPNGIFRKLIKKLFESHPMFLERSRSAYTESIAADKFIRSGAESCGLSFSQYGDFKPYGDDVRNSNLLMSMQELGILPGK